jgi:hypothetical protein
MKQDHLGKWSIIQSPESYERGNLPSNAVRLNSMLYQNFRNSYEEEFGCVLYGKFIVNPSNAILSNECFGGPNLFVNNITRSIGSE